MNTKSKIEKRLSSYWKLELGNVFIVPAATIGLAYSYDSPVGWLSLFAMVPMCGLLLVGGLYWRGKYMSLKSDKSILDRALSFAHRLQFPLLILTIAACALSIAAFSFADLTRSKGDLIVTFLAAVMAALEYVNYYHRQVQHFDHMADFKRLLSGRGFRRSQMSHDLEAWRKGRAATS